VPRNLLDILAHIERWTGFTRNFGPLSGDDSKLRNARERYLLTVFAIGCNLGPNQAARHMSNGVTPPAVVREPASYEPGTARQCLPRFDGLDFGFLALGPEMVEGITCAAGR